MPISSGRDANCANSSERGEIPASNPRPMRTPGRLIIIPPDDKHHAIHNRRRCPDSRMTVVASSSAGREGRFSKTSYRAAAPRSRYSADTEPANSKPAAGSFVRCARVYDAGGLSCRVARAQTPLLGDAAFLHDDGLDHRLALIDPARQQPGNDRADDRRYPEEP